MSLVSIPINPLLNDKDEIVSLSNFTSDPIKPNPFEGADNARNEFGEEYKLSVSSSSKLEISAVGGVENDFNSTTFIHDSIIYKLSRAPIQNGSNLVKGTWWGYGIRLKIIVKNVQFGVGLSWGALSAAAQLGYLDAEFELEGIGITDAAIFGLLPEPTDLNMDSLNDILKIGNTIRGFVGYADPSGVLYKPLRIEVDESDVKSVDPISDDRHYIFTYKMVSNRKKPFRAMNKAIEYGLDPQLVKKYYAEIFSITNEGEKPSNNDRSIAEEWLNR